METVKKKLLVLSSRAPLEAMRVAAGLTIFGHEVALVFTGEPLSLEIMESETAELLALSEIEPETTIPEMAKILNLLDSEALARAIMQADGVINI